MFDEVTKREGGKQAARRGAWVIASSALQAALVVAVIVVSTKIAAEVAQGPIVDVKFVKQAAAPPPPPPPPAPRPRRPPKPKTEAPKPTKAPNPMAMVQPREVPQELKPPDPNEPPEPEPEYDDSGAEGGVIGGVVGSTGAAPSDAGGVEDAPVYATGGFRPPKEAERGCVGRTVRVPRDLAGFVSSLTVKFAVNRDGSVALFQVMGQQQDPRIGQAVWAAIQNCRFTPGTDPTGKPVNIWMILPIRFTSG